jgi:hypothetical protein
MPDHAEPFSTDALAENRSGRLTADQTIRFQRMVGDRRRSTRGVAVPFGAIGALLLIFAGPTATAATRHVAGWVFVAAAAAIFAAPTFDPLAADVREARVDTVQGAVRKRRMSSSTRTGGARYYLDIADCRLRTYRSAYDTVPDAGFVRAYYLPRTRRLVNLERLPNRVPSGPEEAREMLGDMVRGIVTGDPVIRAKAAGLVDAAQELMVESSDAPSGRVAGGLVREALVGRWTHPLVTVTLAEDGTATVTTIAGTAQAGHWSVDSQGRLLTDVTGTMEPTAAALDDGRLTIQLEGRRLTFSRAAGA